MRQKQKRFQENKLLDALIEPEKTLYTTIKGKWNQSFFSKKQPITLEIGCGHGAYTIGLARLFPERNVIGIDIKGDRLWKGAKEADAMQLSNVAFLRAQAEQLMHFFAPNEVVEIWIPFPDPRPKNRDIKRRLTSPRFLALYQSILTKGGIVHLKTDSALLFFYTLDLLQQQGLRLLEQTTDVYASTCSNAHMLQHSIQTAYEKRFLTQGLPTHYLCFSMPE